MSGTLFFPLSGNEAMARELAERTLGEIGHLEMRAFPDGETYLAFAIDPKARDIALVSTLSHPNGKFLPLIFAAQTARELGAKSVGLVAPYLCYMRQDKRFHAGEAVTSRIFAALVSRHVDWLVTLDPHLHRYASLAEIYSIPAQVAHATNALGDWIRKHVANPFLIGPDEESRQWVSIVAAVAGAPYAVLSKERLGDREVRIAANDLEDLAGMTPVLVDDIISSGATMLEALHAVRPLSRLRPVVVAVHAIFAGDCDKALEREGALLVSTNSITHGSNRIDIADPLAAAFGALKAGKS